MSLSAFSKVLFAASGVQLAFGLNELGQKCGAAQAGPPYGDCAPGFDCVDQAKYNQFGEVDYYLEYATCERPEGTCVEEQTWWSKPLQKDYLQGKRAVDIAQELREAGWKVNAVLEIDGVVNEQPDTRLAIFDADDDPRFTAPGLIAHGSFRVHMSRPFRRDIAKLKIVMEAAWSESLTQNYVDVAVNSPGRFRGEAIQIQGGQGANSIQTWIVSDIRKGDVLEIKEHISSISLHEISIVCEETPAPSLPPQPEGPKVEVEIFHGCEEGAESETMEFIWAPDACQLDQVHDPTEEIHQPDSIMFSCVKDGSLWVRQYHDTATCEGQPAAQFFIMHGREMQMGGEGEGQCLKFHLDEIIRNACELPELTQMPTVELTQNPTVQLTQTPTARPVGPPVKCHSTGDPHMRAFHYEYDNSQIVWRTRQQQWFDFQNRGEFSLWETQGLSVQARHGSRLDFLTTRVSTNNAFAIGGDWMCGETVEIYGYDGYFLRQGADEWTGKAQVFTSMSQWDNRVTCDSVEVHVDLANERVQFTFDQAIVKVELKFYGINIWIDVEGAAYLETDTGICPKSEGWNTELNCDSLFTFYQTGDCSTEPKPTLPPIDVNACDETLKAEAEKRCNACPDVVSPEECVAEVCALNDIAAAAVLLESCDIEDTPIRPRPDVKCQCTGDPHCTWFDGVRQDFQARGEFVFYQNKGVTVMTRQGYRPDVKHADHISTNHGVAIGGAWTCGKVYEFFYDRAMGHADPVRTPVPMLKIGSDEFYGLADIIAELTTGTGHCARIVNNGNVIEFILAEDAMRVRVQPEWWGINVFVDLDGRFNLSSDNGMCTRKEGSFTHVPCEDTIFTHWDGACETQPWNEIPPEVLVVPACDSALRLEALEVCDACPDIVTVDECLFETCTLGSIDAAHEMVKACLAVPVDPVPVPTPAPKPDVFCWSHNDPHFIFFDGLKAENMDHGHFSLYKTAKFEIQSRQGPNLMFDRSANVQQFQSTNNALVIAGELICGATLEVEALQATENQKSFISAKIIITKAGETHEFDYETMLTEKAKIGELTCSDVRVGNGYGGDGHIFRLNKDGYEFMFQARKHGINTKVTVPGDKYLSSDSGVCTKRGDYNRKLECSEILFTAFPAGNCEEEKNNDKDITPPTDVLENCDADLKSEARQICNQCPNVVSPAECVWETCLLGHIRFAEEQVAACDMDIPKDDTCGFAGKLKKKGRKISMKKFLKSKRSIAPTACKCREACLKSGGTEWMWKSKKGKCLCHVNTEIIIRYDSEHKNRKGLIVGSFNGSPAEIFDQASRTKAPKTSKPSKAPRTARPTKAPRNDRTERPTPEPTTAGQFTTEWVKIVGIKDVFTTLFPESAKDTMMVNADNPDAEIFMNIGEFDFDDARYLDNGKYTFKMVYGGVNFVDGADNEVVFKQSSKPTETTITGYEWVSGIVDTWEGTTSGLRGVARNTAGNVSKCLLDGDGEMISWWNCMAPTGTYYGQGLPAINRRVAKSAALYILDHRA